MIDKFLRFQKSPLWNALKKVQELILVICGALCCLIFVIEVFVRYILKIDFKGYDELVLLFAIWLYFIGGSYATYKKEHISADMLNLILKGRPLQVAQTIVNWVTFLITVILAIWGVDFFIYALSRTATTTVWRMPQLWSQSALTVGYILMALYEFFYALENTVFLFETRRGKEGREEGTQ